MKSKGTEIAEQRVGPVQRWRLIEDLTFQCNSGVEVLLQPPRLLLNGRLRRRFLYQVGFDFKLLVGCEIHFSI